MSFPKRRTLKSAEGLRDNDRGLQPMKTICENVNHPAEIASLDELIEVSILTYRENVSKHLDKRHKRR